MAEILIVDDERVMREGLRATLVAEGFAVRVARDGADALVKFDEARPDLVLLDVMMPKMNGFVACEEIRKRDRLVPIVFLTAKASEADQVRGMGLGADDYVAKDAAEAVLLARIRRALERASAVGDALVHRQPIRLGSVTVDLDTMKVSGPQGDCDVLTKSELDILRIFASNRGRTFTTDEIIAELRGQGFACEDSLVYSHVSRLRRKLGPSGELLQNVRGLGYRLIR